MQLSEKVLGSIEGKKKRQKGKEKRIQLLGNNVQSVMANTCRPIIFQQIHTD